MKGKWRIVKMPDYTSDYPDMVEPAYISFDGKGGGQFTFGCVTGAIYGAGDGNAIEFTWDGNDEMDDASGDGWAELQRNGALKGQICFHGGDKANFTARPWKTSSTACSAITKKLRARWSITRRRRNLPAKMSLTCSFSTPRDLLGNFIST